MNRRDFHKLTFSSFTAALLPGIGGEPDVYIFPLPEYYDPTQFIYNPKTNKLRRLRKDKHGSEAMAGMEVVQMRAGPSAGRPRG